MLNSRNVEKLYETTEKLHLSRQNSVHESRLGVFTRVNNTKKRQIKDRYNYDSDDKTKHNNNNNMSNKTRTNLQSII